MDNRCLYLLASILIFSSCREYSGGEIIVKGMVKNIPATKIYLTDAFYWRKLVDSADYVNDTFSFHLSARGFEPHLVTLCFFDKKGKRHLLAIENYLLSTNERKYSETAFMVDKGRTIISGNYFEHPSLRSHKLHIKGSKQNDPLFKTQLRDFGWLNDKDVKNRMRFINSYKTLIKKYPYSYYFIQLLYDNRTSYTRNELTELLSLFDDDIQHGSSYGEKFSYYFKETSSPGQPLTNFILKDSMNRPQIILNSASKLNMIIFWASWCGPCRKEIPELKIIYGEFNNESINMVGVSVDRDSKVWRSVLEKEQTGWRQLIVEPSLLDKVKSSYNFSDIPIVIFTDNKGKEIIRFIGYKPNNINQYRSIIEKYLK